MFYKKKKIFGKVLSWIIGDKTRRQDVDSTKGPNTPDSTNFLNDINPNSMNLLDPEPDADLNLWHLAAARWESVTWIELNWGWPMEF